jgi:hypothetical protein
MVKLKICHGSSQEPQLQNQRRQQINNNPKLQGGHDLV